MRFITLLLCALSAFAGKSITFGPQLLQATVPNTPSSRLELYLHDWGAPTGTTHIVESSSAGWRVYTQVSGTSVQLVIYNQWETVGGTVTQFEIGSLSPQALYIRAQHDAPNKTDLVEVWDTNGNHLVSNTNVYTTEVNAGGTTFQMGLGSESTVHIAFMRVYSNILPINSRPPTTVDNANRFFEWKFDSSLGDASGNGYTIGYFTGTPAYVDTPFQNVISVVKTADATSWTNVLTQRAGRAGNLDGTSSYSQNDSSATVTYFWQQLSGPSSAIFSSRTSGTPTLTGLSFGDYRVQLTVTDAGGLQATAADDFGAVASDSKGVIVNAVSSVVDLLGDMLSYGKNLWQFQDKWITHASTLRSVKYAASVTGSYGETYPGWSTLGKPQWEFFGQGTVAYPFNCQGHIYACDQSFNITTTAQVDATSTTIPVTVNSGVIFTISSFPARVVIYDGTNADEYRIVSRSGTGPAYTYTMAYDPSAGTRHTFLSGANVLLTRVQGTGTLFVTDPNAAVCPTGINGALPGISSYSAGTVALTAGSATITGSGTTWQAPTTQAGEFVQVSATHSATPFTFVAQILTGGAITGGSGAPNSATLSSGVITAVVPYQSAAFGQSYTTGVTVVITDSVGTGAAVTANIVGGAITSYTVTNGGSGYVNPTVTVKTSVMTLARAFPASADTASGLSYKIMPWTRTLDLTTVNPVDSTGIRQILWPVTGCESETDLYINIEMGIKDVSGNRIGVGNSFIQTGHDVGVLNGTPQSLQNYSVTDTQGWVSPQGTFGNINFYGEDIANWALYYRSGLATAKSGAKVISDWWARSPFTDFCCSLPLSVGGGRIGAFISVITGQNTTTTWPNDLRIFAAEGAAISELVYFNPATGTSLNCNTIDDSRDLGYLYAQLILAAIYDPDTSSTNAPGGIPWRMYWQNFLPHMLAGDTACARANGSFSTGFYYNSTNQPQLTMMNGSTAVTGSANIPSTLCTVTAQGSGTVTTGSAALAILSGSMPAGGETNAVMVTGTKSGAPFVQYLSYTVSGSTATLGAYWLGDTGTILWQAGGGLDPAAGSGNTMLTIAESSDDITNLKSWACVWNNSSSITLNRTWDGVSSGVGHTFYPYLSNLAGFGQQPFMLGIRTYGQGLLANQTLPALATYKTSYSAFQNNAAAWVWNTGMDPVTLTTNYGVFNQSSPVTTVTAGTTNRWRSPGSSYGLLSSSGDGLPASREQNTETGYAHVAYYLANPTTPNKLLADQYYGAVWGDCNFTVGVYCSADSTAAWPNADQFSDASINNGKWFGFFGGMGMSSRWPATRVGGVDPSPSTKTLYLPFYLPAIPGATQIHLTITLPSGVVTVYTCSVTPCAVVVDPRIGDVLAQIDYLNAGGVTIAPGQPYPLYIQ